MQAMSQDISDADGAGAFYARCGSGRFAWPRARSSAAELAMCTETSRKTTRRVHCAQHRANTLAHRVQLAFLKVLTCSYRERKKIKMKQSETNQYCHCKTALEPFLLQVHKAMHSSGSLVCTSETQEDDV